MSDGGPLRRVAIVGGGITGAVAASTLLDAAKARSSTAEEGQPRLVVELFDQAAAGLAAAPHTDRLSRGLVRCCRTTRRRGRPRASSLTTGASSSGPPEEEGRDASSTSGAPTGGRPSGRASLAARPMSTSSASRRTRPNPCTSDAAACTACRGASSPTPRPGTPTASSCTRASASPRCAPTVAAPRGRSSARQGRRRSTTPQRPTRPRRSRRCWARASMPCCSRTLPPRLASGTARARASPQSLRRASRSACEVPPVQHDGRF